MRPSRRQVLHHAALLSAGFGSGCTSSNDGVSPSLRECALDSGAAQFESYLSLTAEGKTDYQILITEHASDTVRFAATELQEYIEKVTTTRMSIISDADTEHVVSVKVGETSGDCKNQVGRDTFRIAVSGDKLQLIGATPRATLFAVYDFLERYVGVHWPAPGPDREVVPSDKSLNIPSVTETRSPDFGYRIAGEFQSEEYVDWAIKNRLHVTRWITGEQPEKEYVEKRGGYVADTNVHSFFDIIPPEQYTAEHPEYFSKFSGGEPTGQLNITESSLVDKVTECALQFFEEHPDAEFFPITPNDGYGWSRTASPDSHLTAHRRSGHPEVFKHHEVVSDSYFSFVNAVARRVLDEYPEKRIYCLAYINYIFPPVTFPELEPNVVVSIAHYAPADYAHTIDSGHSEANQQFEDILTEWANVADNRWVYEYTVKYALDHLPFPISYRLAKDIKLLHRLGYSGFYSQGGEGRWGQCGPHFYLMAKLLWDSNRSTEKILDDYFEAMFGSASEPMRELYDTLADALSKPDVHLDQHPRTEARGYLTSSTLDTAHGYLVSATKEAMTKREQRNVREMAIPIEYTSLYFTMRDALHAYESGGKKDDLEQAVEAFNHIRDLVRQNKDVDAIPLKAVTKGGYYTLQRYFEPYLDRIDMSFPNWIVK